MIAKSHLFTNILNSVAGITYTRNRYAQIVGRARSKPVNVRSNLLELARTHFNAAVSDWKGLTDVQRETWIDFAKDTPWKNGLGDDISLTGQAMYIGQVAGAVAANPAKDKSELDTAPCVPGLFPTPLLTFGCCVNPTVGVIVTVQNQHHSNDMDAVVRISPPQSPSTRYYTGPWETGAQILLEGIAAGATDDAEFCPLCDARYYFQCRCFDAVDGNNMSSLVYGSFVACTDPI